ncbi:acetylxylan esterase [Gluconacetobacter azotocaptans]|uniref:alpha/beta hydrolase n=1 Tax=Gluconacetobacter azotocaptans TaxID=142834 RepID=UPI00195D3140|nr:CocE/NonD family hydrolase [Gluconacetobacter azotocaptans]MBM9400028.1 acetylxylan esterase [Gluconacetobacter azotocaptans]
MASSDSAPHPPTIEQHDVAFDAEPGVVLRGWLLRPAGAATPLPAITMAHGYAGTAHHGLFPFARAFAETGFVVLLHDHRNFGSSDAPDPGDIDPWRQIADWRSAISFLESRPEVDAALIGLWGTSYAGGHAIFLGATDRRLRAVVTQVPTISGYEQGLRRVEPGAVPGLETAFIEDDRRRFRGEPGHRIAVVGSDQERPAAYRSQDAIDFYLQELPEGVWRNEVTLRSGRAARMYEPGAWIARVSPTPLMLVVAMADTITLTDLALVAYERALQPKKLVTVQGGDFDPYLSQFSVASAAAVGWFHEYLVRSPGGQPCPISA